MSGCDGPSWLTFTITHCDDNRGETIDRYTAEIRMEYRGAGDKWGDTSEYQYWYYAMDDAPTHPQGFSQTGEDWIWEEDDPDAIKWESLPEHIRRHVILRCLEGIDYLNPVEIWFEDESQKCGSPEEIDLAAYGIDIKRYLHQEEEEDA